MILVSTFKVDQSKLQLEAEMIWDSDTETLGMIGIIHVPMDTLNPNAGTMIVRQPMDKVYSDIPGCALLDLIGEYNIQGKLLNVELFTAAEYWQIMEKRKDADVSKYVL